MDSGVRALIPGRRFWRAVLSFLFVAAFLKANGATFNIANGDVFTLQNAITTANSNGQDDTINLAAGGTYIISSIYTPSGGRPDDGLPAIGEAGHSVTVNGNGATIYRSTSSGVANFRIFEFINGSGATVTNLTIDNGSVLGDGQFVNSAGGGGILNNIPLTVTNCTFRNNSAGGGAGIETLAGGTLVVLNSTFDHNSDNAVQNVNGSATLSNCTFVDVDLHGQTIGTIHPSGLTTVTNCTIVSANICIYVKDGAVTNVGSTILKSSNTVFEDNFQSSHIAAIHSSGYNLSVDNGLAGFTDQTNVDPRLDPAGLQDNGGPTQTIALTFGSPAIDRGKAFATSTDQRGVARPFDNASIPNAVGSDGSDVGAYEAPQDPIQSGASNFPMVVTSTSDHNDGLCTGSDCTLREAVARANSLPISSTITFAPNVTGSIQFQAGDSPLLVNKSVTITGPGARALAINALTQTRVFEFDAGTSVVSGLTIIGGFVSGASGTAGTGYGGAILNLATLTIDDCAISESSALGGSAGGSGQQGGAGQGGGIYNTGTLTVNRCLFQHNQAIGGAGSQNLNQFATGGTGGEADGAAIFNSMSGVLAANNCTFFNNETDGGAGAKGGRFGGNGGGANGSIFNQGSASVVAGTISANPAFGGTGGAGSSQINHGVNGIPMSGIIASAGSTSLTNTICASNNATGFTPAYDVAGTFSSGGYNLIGTAESASGFAELGDQTGTNSAKLNPLLGPLQNNGGPTNTLMPLRGSSAVDAGIAGGLTLDQRNQPRPVDSVLVNAAGGDGSDIGAVEVNFLGGPDTDGDGMSDDYELFYGLNPNDPTDAAGDADHDGLTNLQEFQSGTNPLDGKSGFSIISLGQSGTAIVVTFGTALPQKTYRLERKDVMTDQSWNSIDGVVDLKPTSVGSGQITDPNGASGTRHFYHVRVVP